MSMILVCIWESPITNQSVNNTVALDFHEARMINCFLGVKTGPQNLPKFTTHQSEEPNQCPSLKPMWIHHSVKLFSPQHRSHPVWMSCACAERPELNTRADVDQRSQLERDQGTCATQAVHGTSFTLFPNVNKTHPSLSCPCSELRGGLSTYRKSPGPFLTQNLPIHLQYPGLSCHCFCRGPGTP